MKVCIAGAGNTGLVTACAIAHNAPETEVVIYSHSKFDARNLVLHDFEHGEYFGNLGISSSDDAARAFAGASYVICTYPAFLRMGFLNECEAYLEADTKLGFSPGYGGIEYACTGLLERGVTVFAFQRVPFVSRQKNREVATLLSRKAQLHVASIPHEPLLDICHDMERLLGIPTLPMSQYLAATLAPSNPLLHLTGVYHAFRGYEPGMVYPEQLYLYEEWDDSASRMLLEYDRELQRACERIPLDLHEVVSLANYYESPTPDEMTRKLKSIEAFKVVTVPMKATENGFVPDLDSRMFLEDYPYGIAVLKAYSLLAGVETPVMNELLGFYEKLTGIRYYNADGTPGKDFPNTGAPMNWGLNTLEDIVRFYSR